MFCQMVLISVTAVAYGLQYHTDCNTESNEEQKWNQQSDIWVDTNSRCFQEAMSSFRINRWTTAEAILE